MSSLQNPITGVDFIGIPSQDAERSRQFYIETLGLTADTNSKYEFKVGGTWFGIWEPEKMGFPFVAQKSADPAFHVDDVAETRTELESRGVTFNGETIDTGVCHIAIFSDPDGNDVMLHNRYAPKKSQ